MTKGKKQTMCSVPMFTNERRKIMMKRRKMKTMCLMLVCTITGLCNLSYSDYVTLVDVNFQNGTVHNYSGAAATGKAGDQWNNIWNATSTGDPERMNLKDVNGNATAIDIETIGLNRWSCKNEEPYPNELFYSYHGPSQLTISDLDANATYDLYFYSGYNYSTQTMSFTIGGVTKQPTQTNPQTLNSFVENVNYVVFRGISPDANGKIIVQLADTPFNGFQIGQVPEPATIGLLTLGFGLLHRKK